MVIREHKFKNISLQKYSSGPIDQGELNPVHLKQVIKLCKKLKDDAGIVNPTLPKRTMQSKADFLVLALQLDWISL